MQPTEEVPRTEEEEDGQSNQRGEEEAAVVQQQQHHHDQQVDSSLSRTESATTVASKGTSQSTARHLQKSSVAAGCRPDPDVLQEIAPQHPSPSRESAHRRSWRRGCVSGLGRELEFG